MSIRRFERGKHSIAWPNTHSSGIDHVGARLPGLRRVHSLRGSARRICSLARSCSLLPETEQSSRGTSGRHAAAGLPDLGCRARPSGAPAGCESSARNCASTYRHRMPRQMRTSSIHGCGQSPSALGLSRFKVLTDGLTSVDALRPWATGAGRHHSPGDGPGRSRRRAWLCRGTPDRWVTARIGGAGRAAPAILRQIACSDLGIERAGDLVQNQELGPSDQRPRERDALPLPAGKACAPLVPTTVCTSRP